MNSSNGTKIFPTKVGKISCKRTQLSYIVMRQLIREPGPDRAHESADA